MAAGPPEPEAGDVRVQVRGPVPDDVVERARRRVLSLVRDAPEPVSYVRLKLTRMANPAAVWPAIAQVNVDLNGRLVRAQAAAASPHEAVQLVVRRLRSRVHRAPLGGSALDQGDTPAPDARRHSPAHLNHALELQLPSRGREVLRHKAYPLGRRTAAEAAAEMEALDYEFHLFTEKTTGQDSVVYLSGEGYRLALLRPRRQGLELAPAVAPITVSGRPAPTLTLTEAKARIEALGLPFLFFADASTGRGYVLYHRYGGSYGLVTPAD